MRWVFLCLLWHSGPVALAQSVDHSPWTVLLQTHLDSKGLVDYPGFLEDRAALGRYLQSLATARPEDWSPDEQKAFWLNAYNAQMIDSILEHWPVRSPLEIGRFLKIIPTGGVFRTKHTLAGAQRSLNDVEHRILRGRFKDPRIHAALNCASISCPVLRRTAYVGADLDEQLDAAMTAFLLDPTRNRITSRPPQLSAVFKWFRSDFEREAGSIWAYVRSAVPESTREALPLEADPGFLSYDWTLNGR